MGRTEAKQVVKQGTAQSAQNATNAQGSLAATNTALNQYSGDLDNFMKFGRSTYGKNGEFMRDENTLATGAAGAASKALSGDMALNAMRTGANTAGYADTLAQNNRTEQQNVTNQLASADATRLQNLTNINQQGVQMAALPAQVQSSLYGTSTSGESGNLGPAASAAGVPGFWDQNAAPIIQAAGSVAASL